MINKKDTYTKSLIWPCNRQLRKQQTEYIITCPNLTENINFSDK